MIPDELMKRLSSKWFTRLRAYRNRNTLNPDIWFSQARATAHLLALKGVEMRPLDFVPVNDPKADERREAEARAAEEQMDRDSE